MLVLCFRLSQKKFPRRILTGLASVTWPVCNKINYLGNFNRTLWFERAFLRRRVLFWLDKIINIHFNSFSISQIFKHPVPCPNSSNRASCFLRNQTWAILTIFEALLSWLRFCLTTLFSTLSLEHIPQMSQGCLCACLSWWQGWQIFPFVSCFWDIGKQTGDVGKYHNSWFNCLA